MNHRDVSNSLSEKRTGAHLLSFFPQVVSIVNTFATSSAKILHPSRARQANRSAVNHVVARINLGGLAGSRSQDHPGRSQNHGELCIHRFLCSKLKDPAYHFCAAAALRRIIIIITRDDGTTTARTRQHVSDGRIHPTM